MAHNMKHYIYFKIMEGYSNSVTKFLKKSNMAIPRTQYGKAKVKLLQQGKEVSYGQAGKKQKVKAWPRVRPGKTSNFDSYCARSLGIKRGLSRKKQNDPNTPNNLSRKRWKCVGG